MRKNLFVLMALFVVAAMLAACGDGDGGSDPAVDAGKELFAQTVIGSQAGCITCHSLSPGETIVGPSIAGIGSRGEAYIRESILDPNAVLVDGYPADTMPNVWGTELSGEQLDQLVAYLLTLK
jgi:mono/diheme cytochrome c family protein